MVSIVVIHSWYVFGSDKSKFDLALVTPFKFATIGFFLISGFLLGERVDRRSPVEYFVRRFRRVFVPWSFWFGIMCAGLVVYQLAGHGVGHSNLGELLWMAFTTSRSTLYDTAFWFVPNLLLCIAILLMCRRYLYSLKLGLVLLACNLAYVANLYALWFPTTHTRARLGFVFYLWLGSYAAHNFEKVSKVLARIPVAVFVATSLITGIASYWESHLLGALSGTDPLNTLRLSNQAFSISMVLLIFKFSRATWPRFIDVRRHTFGLYLTHSLVLQFFLHTFKYMRLGSSYAGEVEGVLLWLAVSVATYCCCLTVTIWLANRPSLQWMVGLTSLDAPSRPSVNVSGARGLSAFLVNNS
jgi:membrane-bound acyltransferase YfiQ involved in biofilm formation